MKYLLPILCLLCFQANAQFNLQGAHLIAHYPLDGDLLDYSGKNNHLTGYGNIGFTTDKWNRANSAATFDGVDDWLQSPLTTFTEGSFTILFRMRYDDIAAQAIFAKGDPSDTNARQFWTGINNTPLTQGKMHHVNYMRASCTQADTQQAAYLPFTVSQNTWYCVALSYDKDSNIFRTVVYNTFGSHMYNGNSYPDIDTCSSFPLRIGRFLAADPRWFKGDLDEVRVYDQEFEVLTSSDTTLAAYCEMSSLYIRQPFNDTSLCPGKTFNVQYFGGIFSGNNVVSVQLSDATGNFTSPVTIGSATTTAGQGTIACTVPQNIGAGAGYRIRLVSTLTADTSYPSMQTIDIAATPFISAGSNTPVCAGGLLHLNVTAVPGATYAWTGPNFTGAGQAPSKSPVTLADSGIYSVVVSVNGCVYLPVQTLVDVNMISSLGAYPSPNDTLCENNKNASFVAVPFNAGTSPQYQWYKNGNLISGATNISYPATGISDGDTFQCRMIVTGQCPQPLTLFSNKIGITVLPMTSGPSVTITADPPGQLKPWQMVKFTAVATNAGTDPKYQWKRNGQNVSGATAFTWSANNLSHNDTVTCEVTSSVWCANPPAAKSNRIDVNIALGIDDVEGDNGVRIYPNPNNGTFTLELKELTGTVTLEAVNSIGQTVYKSTIADRISQVALPVANGVYMLRLRGESINGTARVLIGR